MRTLPSPPQAITQEWASQNNRLLQLELGRLDTIEQRLAASVIDSIADGDTTHAPSRNAVFDALALKQPLDAGLTALAGGSDFVTFGGPAGTIKAFSLPNADATILTTNAAVTIAQGGTGATTVGANLFTAANPSALTFVRINADNSVTFRSATDMRTDLGLGTIATQNANAVAITGGTVSGITSLSVSGDVTLATAGASQRFQQWINTGGNLYIGRESSVAGAFFTGSAAYANCYYSDNSTQHQFMINAVKRAEITTTGLLTAYGVKSTSATEGMGYATGAGGTVTQITNKATSVTLNKVCGQITMNGAALAANTTVQFTLNNTAIASADIIVLNHVSTGTLGSYLIQGHIAVASAATISVRNLTAGSLSEAIVLGFVIVKSVTA